MSIGTTHEEGVQFVKDVFVSMGGTVIPPERPHKYKSRTQMTPNRNYFLMDFENSCLSQNWDNTKQFPKGPRRHLDPSWAKMIQSHVYPNHSDIDWKEYCEWVSTGGGDEYFQESESEPETEPL